MNIFVISPVRAVTPDFNEDVAMEVQWLETQGHSVYWPVRDTDQGDTALQICNANRLALERADCAYVAWDGVSQGVLFDLGMAWALRKPLVILGGLMPPMSQEKSFQSLCYAWHDWAALS